MTDIRKRKGKLLSEMDMSIDHEKATYDMVMLITEGCRGQMRFRDEFKAIFGFKGKRSNGGYVGVRPEPRITITHDVMDNTQPYLYKEPTNVNKILNIGQFYGSAEYITRAIIAHNIAHAIIETPYLHIKKEYRTNGKISGHHSSQWRKLYEVLREEFVNPYVELVKYNWKEEHTKPAEEKSFQFDVHRTTQYNIKVAKETFKIKDDKKLICCECGDEYIPEQCPHGDMHMNDDGRCMDCHVELCHGGSPLPEENTCSCGNHHGYPEDDIEYFSRICDRFYRV